jgi:hypothetical protein
LFNSLLRRKLVSTAFQQWEGEAPQDSMVRFQRFVDRCCAKMLVIRRHVKLARKGSVLPAITAAKGNIKTKRQKETVSPVRPGTMAANRRRA